ncbi:RES domain-containing protein [Klebsiella variicola]|uniref:RES domain-containing protein n=1 Tax=Klebsiella variicola TaxID=244366 RepID=UPI001432DDD0|nr:RES domain-containing protein [Klebsiella variicola]MCH6141636.1 RES domain-containing protein [Klebsiella variicola]MCH6176560.1 RES domain-containing protein [Klebsiella variicola]NKD41441.1 RES domain-containing protein [Escherichia coli]
MAIWGVSLDEAEGVKNDIEKIFKIIQSNDEALDDLARGGDYYKRLKSYFCHWVRFVRTSSVIPSGTPFYRVRRLDANNENGVLNVSGLKYAPKGKAFGRMNNHSYNVMYSSYHEYTAISECRLKEGDLFQLTRFKSKQPLNYFELGFFSRLYFTTPRDSEFFREQVQKTFGFKDAMDSTVGGFAALESALMDGLYAIHDEPEISYYLSSIIADAIFTEFEGIDAVMFPSLQQRFGVNLSFKECVADNLEVDYTCVNEIINKYTTGNYKYYTKLECTDFTKDILEYKKVSDDLGGFINFTCR